MQALEARLGRQLVQLRRNERQRRELELQEVKLNAVRADIKRGLAEELARLQKDLPPPQRKTQDPVQQAADHCAKTRQLRKRLDRNATAARKLADKIADIEADIEALERRLCDAVRTQSRLRLLIDGDYRLLDSRKKAMMDALRIAASNMFRNVQEQFREIYDNFRDDHVLVRMLSPCSGTMTKMPDAVVFTLWLPGALQAHRLRAFDRFLRELETETNCRLAPHKTIRLKLRTGPVKL